MSCLSYSNVVATLALTVALGGTAVAAVQWGGEDIRDGSLTAADIKPGSLVAKNFAPNELPAGRQGLAGPVGPQGPKGDKGEAATGGTTTITHLTKSFNVTTDRWTKQAQTLEIGTITQKPGEILMLAGRVLGDAPPEGTCTERVYEPMTPESMQMGYVPPPAKYQASRYIATFDLNGSSYSPLSDNVNGVTFAPTLPALDAEKTHKLTLNLSDMCGATNPDGTPVQGWKITGVKIDVVHIQG